MSTTSEEPEARSNPSQKSQKSQRKSTRVGTVRGSSVRLRAAEMTRGGLKKEDLMMSKSGKIVSKKSLSAEALRAVWFYKRVVKKPAKKRRAQRERKR